MIFSSGWTDPNNNPDDKKRIYETLNCWAWRLTPIIESQMPKFTFICSDRVGKEKETSFIGSSCFIQIQPKVDILGHLNHKEQNLLRMKVDL